MLYGESADLKASHFLAILMEGGFKQIQMQDWGSAGGTGYCCDLFRIHWLSLEPQVWASLFFYKRPEGQALWNLTFDFYGVTAICCLLSLIPLVLFLLSSHIRS